MAKVAESMVCDTGAHERFGPGDGSFVVLSVHTPEYSADLVASNISGTGCLVGNARLLVANGNVLVASRREATNARFPFRSESGFQNLIQKCLAFLTKVFHDQPR